MTDADKQAEYLLRKEEEKIARNEAKTEAYKENMIKTFADLIRQENVKKALAREAMDATKNRSRDPLFDKAGQGIYSRDSEIITDLEERFWEND